MYSYDSVWYFRFYAVDIGLRLKYLNSKKVIHRYVCGITHSVMSHFEGKICFLPSVLETFVKQHRRY